VAAAEKALLLGGARTAIGRYGGSLSHIRTDDLLGLAMTAALERTGVLAEDLDEIAVGCVNAAHEGMGDIARWAALAAGVPDHVPAYTVNRFCASSLTSTINLANAIEVGEIELALSGGVESMSRSGWALMKGEAPFMPRGPVLMLDTMWAGAGGPPHPGLLGRDAYIEMIRTAQNVAEAYGLTRGQIDAFALRSHRRAAAAQASGRFAREIFLVAIPATKRSPARQFDANEGVRADTSLEALAGLAPQPNTPLMTAGNSSPLSDGASALVLASPARADQLGIPPIARVRAAAAVGVDPRMMGIAPALAMPRAIQKAGLQPADIEIYEIHEAFAAQVLGVLAEFKRQTGYPIPDERLNPNGGAVALGHPFGDSGARCVLTLAQQLQDQQANYGVVGICVGSGQGVAIVLERV
jgi:acetyl-CoA acetyltransferase family protein